MPAFSLLGITQPKQSFLSHFPKVCGWTCRHSIAIASLQSHHHDAVH